MEKWWKLVVFVHETDRKWQSIKARLRFVDGLLMAYWVIVVGYNYLMGYISCNKVGFTETIEPAKCWAFLDLDLINRMGENDVVYIYIGKPQNGWYPKVTILKVNMIVHHGMKVFASLKEPHLIPTIQRVISLTCIVWRYSRELEIRV